ncbi:alpha-hydroxy acid oxidase [soil metagenome]
MTGSASATLRPAVNPAANDSRAVLEPSDSDSIESLRIQARRRLPRMLYDFVDGGAGEELTLARNSGGFNDWWLRSRAFSSTSERDLSVDVFGSRISMPLMIAPTGASGLLWPHGEAEVAKAAARAGTLMSVSAGATMTMEDVAAAAVGPKWLQLFIYKDKGLTKEFVDRAAAAGYDGIVVTVDAPVHGRRRRDIRNGFTMNPQITLGNIVDAAMHMGWWRRMAKTPRVSMRNFEGRAAGGMADMAAYIASVLQPEARWDDLSWLRGQWRGPLIIKGILHPADAREAVDRGIDGIQVSNHGGRQLDTTLSAIDALPGVVDAVAGRVPVFLDGGIGSGSQVVKAVALGARACLIGRAHLWGLAIGGQAGVARSLEILREEIDNVMAIGGWSHMGHLNRDCLTRLPVELQRRE